MSRLTFALDSITFTRCSSLRNPIAPWLLDRLLIEIATNLLVCEYDNYYLNARTKGK